MSVVFSYRGMAYRTIIRDSGRSEFPFWAQRSWARVGRRSPYDRPKGPS